MSIARRPRRTFAALLGLVLIAGLLIPAASARVAVDAKAPAETSPSPWWVEWLEAFDLNHNKIDDEADALAARRLDAGRRNALIPVLVTFRPLPRDMGQWLNGVGAASDAYVFKTQPVVDLNIPARNLSGLSRAPGVVAVEYDRPLYPVLNVSAPAIQANRGAAPNTFYNGRTAEDLGYTGQGMVVAVLDTGVQDQHASFTGKWIAGTDVSPQIPAGTACFNPPDDAGHGTHVASTAIGASGAQLGTAKAAKLVEVKIAVGGATAQIGPATIGSTNRGFEFVKIYNDRLAAGNPLCGSNDDHIDVATLSFGSLGRGGPNAGSAETFVDALVNSGVAVTVAVGNCGPSPSSTCTFGDDDNGISSPGNAAGAIGVASFNDLNTVDRANDVISAFSSRGPNNSGGQTDAAAGGATSAANLKDRYRKPDVAAPGQSISAAGPVPFTSATLSGTSMATPHVAGVAALLLQAGEQVRDQTGGVNLMASTGNGFTADAYSLGTYPVRDALAHATEYKEAGAKALWTGPNSRGVRWNNAWGYGQVNAFGAVCWAWANVLAPGGATAPSAVADGCGPGGGSGDPTSTPTDPSSPSPTESVDPAASSTYYFHSLTGDNTLDQTQTNGATFDTTFPTFPPDQWSKAQDLPGLQNAGFIEVVDPTWRGTLKERAASLSVDFWGDQIPDPDLSGTIHYTVRVLPAGQTAYLELLPAIVREDVQPGLMNVKHTFTQMRTSSTAPATPLDLPAGALTFTIRGTFTVDDAYTELRFDSTNFPAGFTTNPGGGPEPTETPTESPSSPGPSESPTEEPPTGGRGTYPLTPDDPYFARGGAGETESEAFAEQWGPKKIQAPQAWQQQQATGHGIKVAIIDSGLDVGHPDFACPGKVSVVPGSDAVRDGDGPQDVDGHGTHVAGIIGACTNNGEGIAGVAPDATLMPIQVFSSDANYDGDGDNNGRDDLADAIRLAADSGAHVINMSLSFGLSPVPGTGILGSQYEYTNFQTIPAGIREAIKYAQEKGVVVVAAAGNDTTLPICDYPAIAKDVVCVGATDPRDVRTWYSNGANKPQTNGSFGPAVVAPGGTETVVFCDHYSENVLSTYARNFDSNTCDELQLGYQTVNGTSMASPHVAAVAALVYDRLAGVRTAPNAQTVINAIKSGAVDLGAPGYDPIYAFGRVDALGAVNAVQPVVPPTAVNTTVAFTDGSADAGSYGDEATIAARLVDDTGAPIVGAELVFELTGEDGSERWTATTDADGVGAATRTLTRAPGTYNLTVGYAGETDVYKPDTDQKFFDVVKEQTVTILDVAGKGSKRTLTATLNEDDAPALAGQEIVFYANGTEIGRATTNEDGVAVLPAPQGYRGDHFLFEARFAGTENYQESSGSDQT